MVRIAANVATFSDPYEAQVFFARQYERIYGINDPYRKGAGLIELSGIRPNVTHTNLIEARYESLLELGIPVTSNTSLPELMNLHPYDLRTIIRISKKIIDKKNTMAEDIESKNIILRKNQAMAAKLG